MRNDGIYSIKPTFSSLKSSIVSLNLIQFPFLWPTHLCRNFNFRANLTLAQRLNGTFLVISYGYVTLFTVTHCGSGSHFFTLRQGLIYAHFKIEIWTFLWCRRRFVDEWVCLQQKFSIPSNYLSSPSTAVIFPPQYSSFGSSMVGILRI